MRRSGDIIFADVTISLRGDTSFKKAHEISDSVERNIKNKIPNTSTTIHFEPNWKDVPLDAKILDIAQNVDGVKGVHNVTTHKTKNKTYSNLHVMVQREIDLSSAHKISEIIEQKIQDSISNKDEIKQLLQQLSNIDNSKSFALGIVVGRIYNAFYYQSKRILNREPTKQEFKEFLEFVKNKKSMLDALW